MCSYTITCLQSSYPNNVLLYVIVNSVQVNSCSWADADAAFCTWLKQFTQAPILLAQNCLLFDAGVLLRQASSELKAALAEFADSLPALKEAQPGMKSYSVGSLQQDLVPGLSFRVHHAEGDVEALV